MKMAWVIGGGCALVAALATWLIGFIQPKEAFVTTTIALLMGLGGFWMAEQRRRRWGWILVLVSLVFSAFVANGQSGFQLLRFPFGLTSLLFALIGATTRPRKRRDTDEAEEPGGAGGQR